MEGKIGHVHDKAEGEEKERDHVHKIIDGGKKWTETLMEGKKWIVRRVGGGK